MRKTGVRLQVTFDFELAVPERLEGLDHETLCKTLDAVLGTTVTQGMPTVTAKQLARAGIDIVRHHHHIDARHLVAPDLDRTVLIAAAPHLTDAELEKLANQFAGKAPGDAEALRRLARRKALAMVSDYRLVDCVVTAILSAGASVELEATLNLTNGSVLVAEKDKQQRLKTNQGPLPVRVPGTDASLNATFSGQTLTGPVLSVDVAEMATHRDTLITRWQGR